MKKLFKKLLAVALVGAMVGFVGCKDYDDDIDALNNRLDGIENNQIKGINDQIASMQSSISSLQSAQSATQAAVETLKTTVATLTAKHDADIQDLKGADIELQAQISVLEAAIKALEAKDADLQAQIDSINETMKTMASMSWVEATLEAYATSEEVAAAIGELEAWLGEVGIRLANLESQVTELQILGDEHAKAIDAANAKIEALQAQLDKAIEDLMAWVGEQLSGYITASYFEGYMTEYTAKIVSTLEEISNAIEDDYKEYTDEAVKNAVEAFKAQVVATLEEMSNAIEADRARDLEALKEQIVATLEEMSNAIEADRKRDLTALQEAIVAQLEEMSNAIEADRARDIQDALDKVVAQLEETSNAIEHDYKEYADAVVAQLRDDVVNTLMEMSAGIEADMEKLKGVIEENYTAAIEEALAQVVSTLEEMSNAIEADRARDLAALKEQVVATLEEMSNAIEADYKKEIAAAIENNNGVLRAEFTEAMAELSKTLDSFIEEIQKQMLATKINVNALMNRIQSMVYVPEYDDHKASFPVLTVANDNGAEIVAEGKLAMTFQVTPATAAKKLVALGKDVFHYELKEVKTRVAGFGLEIEDVVLGDKPGQFVVIAQTKNTAELIPDMIVEYTEVDYTYKKYTLQPTEKGHNETIEKPGFWPYYPPSYENVWVTDYYTYELVETTVTETIQIPTVTYKAKKSYSVALHVEAATNEEAVEATKSDVVSHYVNLLPYVETLQGIEVGFEKDGDIVTMREVDYKINWDDVTTKIHLLDGFAPYLVIDGEQIALADAQKIYNLPELKKVDSSNKVFNKDGKAQDPHNFMINHGELYECDEVVSLAKAEKKWLGDYVETIHTYYFGEDDAPLFEGEIMTKVTIVKPTVTLQLAPVTYYWWYQDYLTFFAAEKPYEGTEFAGTTFKSYVTAGVLPEGITPAEIAGGQHVAYIKGEDGKYNSSVVRVRISASGEDEDGVYFSLGIKNWAFNKDYSVKVTKELEAIDVNFVFDASFVGLPEKVEYAYAEAVMPYKAADNAFVTTVAEADKGKALAAIYEAVGADAEVKKYFAKVDEFVNLVTALKGASPLTAVELVATRVSGGDEETATNVTDVTMGFLSPENITKTALLSPRYSTDLFDAYYQVMSSDVVTDADAFEFKTSIITEPGLVIELTGAASIEMPAYRVRHSQTWVADPTEENDFFHSYVKGLWTPEMKKDMKLTAFSTSKIELQSAFILQEYKDGLWKDLTAMPTGVSFKYAITDKTYDKPGIAIDDTKNELTYNGATESVNVLGKLFVNDVEITSAFKYDETDYTTYRVFKYDPLEDVKEIHTEDQDINTSAGKEQYTFNIWKNLSILDKRGAEIVNQSAESLTDMWNKNNASFGESAATLFGIQPIVIGDPLCLYAGTNDEADGLEGRIEIVDGVITFKNMNNLAIQKNIEVRVPVKVTYFWGVKEGYVVYNILK